VAQSGPHTGQITQWLMAAREGDGQALDRLFERLYPELREMAAQRLQRNADRLQLDTTALVHECYLKLCELQQLSLNDRGHFMAYAAKVMRSVVVDLARAQQAQRRGGEHAFITLNTALMAQRPHGEDEVLAIHDALQGLAAIDARLAQVVELRYFVGLSHDEIAQTLGVGLRTVERDWERARTYLFTALQA